MGAGEGPTGSWKGLLLPLEESAALLWQDRKRRKMELQPGREVQWLGKSSQIEYQNPSEGLLKHRLWASTPRVWILEV